MESLLHNAGIAATVAIFSVSALAVWISGAALSRHADAIAALTGLGRGFTGVLLLGAATSLPELATTLSASAQGYPSLAGTNLLGSVTMQIAVLAVVDGLVLRSKALTHFSATPTFLMQGVLLALLLAIAAAGIAVGEFWTIGPVGFWSLLLAAAYGLALVVMYRYEGSGRWEPAGVEADQASAADPAAPGVENPLGANPGSGDPGQESDPAPSLGGRVLRFLAAATGVLVSGYLVATSGARLTEVTGLDETLVGASLVAIATSLPEVSTTVTAVRMGSYAMAVGNILGTNALDLALFLPADLVHPAGTVIDALDGRAVFITALGIVLTCIYLWGVLERRDRTLWGFGVDSVAVIVVYAAGMVLLYQMG
ncbi:MAG: hypothetical protein R3233_09915 [Xanthomonadales bacterium]|nr:hypothetical protein [Xanthomonadales bacterium]